MNKIKEKNRISVQDRPVAQSDGDLVLIHTQGLNEGIRCAMCTNGMKSDRGCDGSCVVNNAMYKKVIDVIESNIAEMPSVTPQEPKSTSDDWIPVAEQLPKEYQRVIYSTEYASYSGVYHDNGFYDEKDEHRSLVPVCAWQPMPQPYKKK